MPLSLALLLLVQAPASSQQPVAARAETVRLTVAGGALVGKFIDAGKGAPAVLLFHMCDPKAVSGWAPVAERLAVSGISSLAVAYRGYGDSRGQTASTPGDQREPDADAVLSYLKSEIGPTVPLGVTGASCGVEQALRTAKRHPERMRAVVVFAGPHSDDLEAHIRKTPGLAVFSGSSAGDKPAPDWARALKAASRNPASRVLITAGTEHGTNIFRDQPEVAGEIANWLVQQLKR